MIVCLNCRAELVVVVVIVEVVMMMMMMMMFQDMRRERGLRGQCVDWWIRVKRNPTLEYLSIYLSSDLILKSSNINNERQT